MASASKKPAVLILHGAYMFAESWDPFRNLLSKAGYESVCPQIASNGDKKPADQKSSLDDDAKIIQTAARKLVAEGRQILAVAHSYGGAVACSALTDDLFATGPDTPGITHIVWLASWIPQPGKTIGNIFEKHGLQSSVDLGFNEDGTAYAKNAVESFFGDINDVDPDRAAKLAAEATTANWVTTAVPVAGAPWKHASTYVVCTKDKAIFASLQQLMIDDVVEAGGKMERVQLDAGHCAFLSRPDEVLSIIEKAGAK